MIHIALKKYLLTGNGKTLLDISISLEKNQLVTISGPSGAGKSSILKMIAGILQPDAGHIDVNGHLLYDGQRRWSEKIQKRKVGMVFQDYALFPNMTVKENLLYAAVNRKEESTVNEILQMMELSGFENRKPATLSGGQQQRVALGRALVQKPEILLLDEPLSALDDKTRYQLQNHIIEAHKKFQLTTLLVSHDVSEILRMSDHVYLLEEGKIVNHGAPGDLYGAAQISGKYQLSGTVLKVRKEDFLYILEVIVGNQLIKVVVNQALETFSPGDKVVIASKAFNPIVKKI